MQLNLDPFYLWVGMKNLTLFFKKHINDSFLSFVSRGTRNE